MIYGIHTHRHVGDNTILTGAVRNVRAAHPDIMFAIPDGYGELYIGNGDFALRYPDKELGRVTYGTLDEERRAANGNLVEGFTRSLCAALNIPPVPIVTRTPVFTLSEDERGRAERWRGKWLINATFQSCGWSKGYPYWQTVADLLRRDGFELVQIGGNESRDISCDLEGVRDMRGRTSLRELVVMLAGCAGVITPPSCSANIAAAFGTRAVVVVGGRELPQLSDYPNQSHVVGHCAECGWGDGVACVSLHLQGSRSCAWTQTIDGIEWCDCMANIEPSCIVAAVERI